MAKNLTVELHTTNLGPHESLSTKLQMSNLEIGIYANNGAGKTFLSRAFRLITKNSLLPEDSNRLLTMRKNDGLVKLRITNSDEPGKTRELELNLIRNATPVISKNTTEYLFRVFNEEYVKENLEQLKFKPNGEIDGYILSKEKIDLSKEKEELEKLKKQLDESEKKLRTKIAIALKDLDSLSINKNTTEYRNIRYENLLNHDFKIIESESFDALVQKHNQLKSLPDNLEDLKNIDEIKPSDILKQVDEFLKEKFSKNSIAEDFKLKVKKKQEFIELGVGLVNKSKKECPFCEQELKEDALKLINKYLEYFSEVEAKQIKRANDLIGQLNKEKKNYYDTHKASVQLQNDFLKNQKFIPSLSESTLSELMDAKDLGRHFDILKESLEKKKEDITISISSKEIDEAITQIKSWITKSNESSRTNAATIQIFNERKNNSNAERLELNRRLCRARYNGLKQTEDALIKEIEKHLSETQKMETDILQKEQSEKISKKDKVISAFKELLNKFFRKKYSFDEKTFCLKFQDNLLETNASDVLSSGEKSVIAFCYYIAETHKFIEKEEDYEKLFFIIDDPISSQDFHFVYATSQIIRTLNKLFNIKRLRLLLLTHNLEFMSIVIRNKIIEQKFILINGKIDGLGNELIMPYEEHLRDIYAVSKGKKSPSHTTPNSLRHILETINRFVAPDIPLELFCERIEGYDENEFLYSLMHDGSHGGIRIQKAYTDDMVKSACDVVTKHVSRDFAGQIKLIESQ